MIQGVQLVQQIAPGLLPLFGDALGDDSFHHEWLLGRITAGGEGLAPRSEETRFGKTPLQLGQHDIRRNQPLVARVVAFELRHHGADGRVHQTIAGLPACLDQVGRGLVGVYAMGHAADEGVFVGLLREQGQQLTDPDSRHIGGKGIGERSAIIVAGLGLRVEGVEVGGPSPHPDLDDGLRSARGGDGARRDRTRGPSRTATQQHRGRAEEPLPQGLPPGDGQQAEIGVHVDVPPNAGTGTQCC